MLENPPCHLRYAATSNWTEFLVMYNRFTWDFILFHVTDPYQKVSPEQPTRGEDRIPIYSPSLCTGKGLGWGLSCKGLTFVNY